MVPETYSRIMAAKWTMLSSFLITKKTFLDVHANVRETLHTYMLLTTPTQVCLVKVTR